MEPVEAQIEPFGRQRQPVKLDCKGEQQDVDYYLLRIKNLIESGSYDNVERINNQIIIYPRAVND